MKKNLKHLFSFALCAALLLGSGPNLSYALNYEDTISDGESLGSTASVSNISAETSDTTYSANATITHTYDTVTKTLTITGEGPMDDYPLNSSQQYGVYPAWWGCYAEAEKIIIGDGITYIGEHAFYELNHCCDAMKELVIGDSVEEIAQSAFVWTEALEKVTIGKSLKTVGSSNFGAGYEIAEVHISDLAAYCGINYDEYNASPFEASGIASLYLNDEKITDLVVPEGVMRPVLCLRSG